MKPIKIKSTILLACGLAFVALPRALAEYTNTHSNDAMFKAADTNGDGQLSRTEHAAHSKTMFTDMDTNRDGTISPAEMTAAHAKMKGDPTKKNDLPSRTDAPKPAGNSDKPAKVGQDASRQTTSAAMFAMHDTNKDGRLSATEHAAGCDAMFTQMDTNNDGQLSKEECKEGQKKAKSAY